MEEIKVGDWVRDKEGTIIKVNDIEPEEDGEDIWYKEKSLLGTWKSMIVKHSDKLINLIEVGDYVNGCQVIEIWKKDYTRNKAIYLDDWYHNEAITSIVTKQQFANIEYRIEG